MYMYDDRCTYLLFKLINVTKSLDYVNIISLVILLSMNIRSIIWANSLSLVEVRGNWVILCFKPICKLRPIFLFHFYNENSVSISEVLILVRAPVMT